MAGSKVHLWTCHGEPQQQWEVANGQVKLVGKNLCLDVPDGDPAQWVQVWDCVPGNKNQKFDAAPVSRMIRGRKGLTGSRRGRLAVSAEMDGVGDDGLARGRIYSAKLE